MELFSRVHGWDHLVVASNRALLDGTTPAPEPGFRTVWTTPHRGNGVARVLNWTSYAVGAVFAGMRGRRPSLVYASSPHLLTGLAGYLLSRLRRARFVLEVRDLWPVVLVEMGQLRPSSLLYRLLRRLELFLYLHAEQVVVMARGCEEALVRDGVPRDRIVFLPNGADPEDFVPGRPTSVVRGELGVTGFVAVYAGAHGPANGLEAVLDAAAELILELPDVTFLLIGNGVCKPSLVQQAGDRGLHNVVFAAPVAKESMADVLAACQVGLHVLADVPLFRYGVSPNKLFDYMAAGLPVLTNVEGEVGDLVHEAASGVVVGSTQIASGMRGLRLAAPGQLLAWGNAGREFMRRERSRKALAVRLQGVLDDSQRVRAGTEAPFRAPGLGARR